MVTALNDFSTSKQRLISRRIYRKIQNGMSIGYSNVVSTERGKGRYTRMKNALEGHVQKSRKKIFTQVLICICTVYNFVFLEFFFDDVFFCFMFF